MPSIWGMSVKAGAAGLAALAAPRIGQAARTIKLVFVPAVDRSVLDPVVTGLRSTRIALISSPIHSTASIRIAQPQMVEEHQVDG